MEEQPDPIAGAVKLGFTSESPQQTPKRPDIHLDIQLKDKENNVVYFPDLCEAAGFTVIKTPPRYLSGSESVGSETPHSDWSDNDTPNDFSSPRPSSSGDPLPPPVHEESNEFFKRLLENAEKYAQEAQEEKAKEAKEKPEKNPKKRKEKVSKKEQNYDVSDPFIDDSDLAPFQRDYGNIRPTVEGFFVWKGPLTLQGMVDETETGKKRTKRKPKSGDAKDKPPQPRKKRTVKPKEGEEGSDKINKPKRAYKRSKLAVETKLQDSAQTTLPHFINTNLFQPPVINVTPTPQDFATAFNNAFPPNSPDRLLTTNPTEAPKTPTFNNKVIPDPNKTPGKKKKIYPIEPIRPEIQVLVDAFKVKVDSETFEIKSRFPPNLKPPLMEILTAAYERTLYPKTISELHKTKADLIERLKAAVEEVMPLLIQEYNERQATRALLDSTSATSNNPNGKKFRWDETTRSLLWKIVQAEMSIVVMSNDLWEAEEKSERYSEQTQRKHLYQNLLTVWPSGWMTSYEIARVYSAYKRYLRDRQTTS
ncbi:hypothetical protein RhiirC2_796544 [Rhizophagus irregularis]|uniref:Ubinuclein middle domain-containing protein n=1 Tax=Rhizophagus irregularis TaxID=588596 RepID=A0A2N1M9J4_9GLOM|nr:hypothetical protein RhiirC2_796544 [Rhizophagus irregularis]